MKNNKKLKRLNIEKGLYDLKNSELVQAAEKGAVNAAGLSALLGIANGSMAALSGIDMLPATLMGGLTSLVTSQVGYNRAKEDELTLLAYVDDEPVPFYNIKKRQKVALFAAGLAATVLGSGVGAGVSAGTHKLTTAIIDKIKPEHQIEQIVEVEPMSVVDEIQVEK